LPVILYGIIKYVIFLIIIIIIIIIFINCSWVVTRWQCITRWQCVTRWQFLEDGSHVSELYFSRRCGSKEVCSVRPFCWCPGIRKAYYFMAANSLYCSIYAICLSFSPRMNNGSVLQVVFNVEVTTTPFC
jgi:hypothetical protein